MFNKQQKSGSLVKREGMTSNRSPPLVTASTPETPLDLTVRRPDMDPCDEHVYGDPHYSMPSVSVTPPTPDYTYQQYPANGYYASQDQYTHSMYVSTNQQPYNPDMVDNHVNISYSLGSNHTTPANVSGPPSPCYEQSHSPTEMSGYSSILPKKRKNLWRPYDSKANRGIPAEQEIDTGSDSGSNSSDQELKIQESLEDPVKRRKRNMLRYAEEHIDTRETCNKTKPSSRSSQAGSSISMLSEMESNVSPVNEPMTSFAPTVGMGGYREDSHEKMISSMKKRDVFGWSLKLSKPLEDLNSTGINPTVCQDGEKTYIELQTVKTSNSPGKQTRRQSQDTKDQSPQKLTNAISNQGKRSPGNKNKKRQQQNSAISDKERIDNLVGKTVYIQRRDNVIESFDETKCKTTSNNTSSTETKKGLSLIDLIEEIEADAKKKDQEEVEKTKQRNDNIVKLLEQCNHVKLQALDYLMSNVLIQDKGPTFKNKNEKVQKMLKGDKITSVNMLDVVELQVEMGLN